MTEGQTLYATGKWRGAVAALPHEAKALNSHSCLMLSMLHQLGLGTDPNMENAKAALSHCAEAWDADSLARLSQLYKIQGNDKEWMAWRIKAAHVGHRSSICNLAEMYSNKPEARETLNKEVEYLQKAVRAEHTCYYTHKHTKSRFSKSNQDRIAMLQQRLAELH